MCYRLHYQCPTYHNSPLKELLEVVPANTLRQQVTNDRSAPVLSGRQDQDPLHLPPSPGSGDSWSPAAAPPLATNLQARRSLATWDTDTPRPGGQTTPGTYTQSHNHIPVISGFVDRQTRARSLGRPTRAGSGSRYKRSRDLDLLSPWPLRPVPRESSASPLLARQARGLGDCFRSEGVRLSAV